MPLDATKVSGPGVNGTEARRRPVALWLFAVCFMLLVMVVLGGTTRLTGSGLSIMEWAPLSGALPPLSHAEWERLFGLYRRIPQYALLHPGMDLAGFQGIFWLEWAHRLWGRLMGVVFFVPLVWFAVTGRIGAALVPRLVGLFVLGGLQGAVGWFMVASGFMAGSTSVSAYRLVVHLSLALFLYAAVLWTGLSVWRPEPVVSVEGRGTRWLAQGVGGLVGLTIVAGGFVAGLHAGLTYNSFPLMDGRLVPAGYAALPYPRDWFENIAAVQFDHRLLASVTALTACALVVVGWRQGPARVRPGLVALGGVVCVQYSLGVATLLWMVPMPLAAAHQATAVLLLTASLWLVHALRGAGCAVAQTGPDAQRAVRPAGAMS
jgi:cytochrome c oxidase assembly protein subunit 15